MRSACALNAILQRSKKIPFSEILPSFANRMTGPRFYILSGNHLENCSQIKDQEYIAACRPLGLACKLCSTPKCSPPFSAAVHLGLGCFSFQKCPADSALLPSRFSPETVLSALFLQLTGDDMLWQWRSQSPQCVQPVKPFFSPLLALRSVQPTPAGWGCPISGRGLPFRRHSKLVHAWGASSLLPHHAHAQPQQAQPHFSPGTCGVPWCWWRRSQIWVYEWQWLNGEDYDWGWWYHHRVSTPDIHEAHNSELIA